MCVTFLEKLFPSVKVVPLVPNVHRLLGLIPYHYQNRINEKTQTADQPPFCPFSTRARVPTCAWCLSSADGKQRRDGTYAS